MPGVRLSNISHAIQAYVETNCFSFFESMSVTESVKTYMRTHKILISVQLIRSSVKAWFYKNGEYLMQNCKTFEDNWTGVKLTERCVPVIGSRIEKGESL